MSGYEESTTYQFHVGGEWFSAVGGDAESVEIEETRCNGQEDTHRRGYVVMLDGAWQWCQAEGGCDIFVRYGSQEQADEILQYVKDHGSPFAEEDSD